jgi:hypothetical protein
MICGVQLSWAPKVDPKMVFLTGILLGLPFGFLSGLSTGLVNRHYGVSFRDRSRVASRA